MKPSNRPRRRDMVEAAAAMAASAAVLRLLPFKRIADMVADHSPASRHDPDEVERVARAIRAWVRRLPIAPKCFVCGLTAVWMLRRRGIASTMYYGAATIDGVLKAHVWVKSGELDVVGCENAADYALLATFPDK
jgi:hypothetical protein